MSHEEILNEDRLDTLRELVNMSYGAAAAVAASRLKAYARLRLPRIHDFNKDQATGYLIHGMVSWDQEYHLYRQCFSGDLEGEMVFILDAPSAGNMADRLAPTGGVGEERIARVERFAAGFFQGCATQLAQHLGLTLRLERVVSHRLTVHRLAHLPEFDRFEHLILIDMVLEFEQEQIRGEMFFLTDSVTRLADALDAYLEAF